MTSEAEHVAEIIRLLTKELEVDMKRKARDEEDLERLRGELKVYAARLHELRSKEKQEKSWRAAEERARREEEQDRLAAEERSRHERARAAERARQEQEKAAERARQEQEAFRAEKARRDAEELERQRREEAEAGYDPDWLAKEQQKQAETFAANQQRPDYEQRAQARYVWNSRENRPYEVKMWEKYHQLIELVGLSTKWMGGTLDLFMRDFEEMWPKVRKAFLRWVAQHREWTDGQHANHEILKFYMGIFEHCDKDLFPSNLQCILDLLQHRVTMLGAHL